MKLRNKKTGEIVDFQSFQFYQRDNCKYPSDVFESLSALNEEWEDYKPTEPLIKDEKIRKAVRTWAEANAVKKAEFEYVEGRGSYLKDYFCEVQIEFYDDLELTNRKTYTIAELCGEEDE